MNLLTDNELSLISAIFQKNKLSTLSHDSLIIEIADSVKRNAIVQILADEMLTDGINGEDELNDYGMKIDGIIAKLVFKK